MEAVHIILSAFDRQQKIRLLPFVVTSVFFIIQPYETGSFLGTIFKILPILSLIGYVIVSRSQFPRKTRTVNAETLMPEDPYSFCILIGLCLSLIGDILVSIPYVHLLGGSVFMLVHMVYYVAIEIDGRHKGCTSSSTWLFGLLYINIYLCVQAGFDSMFMKMFICIYFIPLFLTGWKAAAAMEDNGGDRAVLMGCVGACLFIFTDWLVIMEYNEYPIPLLEFFYMLSYYCAQAGWALSTSNFN